MKISIWIEGLVSLNDLLDSPLVWESEYVPSVGDEVDYCNSDETLEFTGEVVKRHFTVGTDEVLLDVEVNDRTYDYLDNYLNEFRAAKGWFKHD